MAANTTHSWEVPGAEISALRECWCANNMTAVMQDYQCCNHPDISPMCTVDCGIDCPAEKANAESLTSQCLNDCPSMCLEVGEYQVDSELCKNCDWKKCWPSMECLTDRAEDAHE